MLRVLSGGSRPGAGAVAGVLLGHANSPAVVAAVLCVIAVVVGTRAAVRICEIRARRTPAQVRATAMAGIARRVHDPEMALRLLGGRDG
jgi:hypothetical protein